jgi:drug/metabolite transporter (DMT)-like permease
MNVRHSPAVGYLLALVATILWSTVFPLVRALPPDLSPIELSFWRWLFTSLGLLPFVLVALKRHWLLVLKNWRWMAPAGILGLSAYSLLMFEAGHTTNATNMALFAATAPISMAILSRIVFRERFSWTQYIGLAIAISGVFVLVLRGELSLLTQLEFTIGDIWMLLAATFFAVYSILIRRRPAYLPQNLCMAGMMFFAMLTLSLPMATVIARPTYHLPSTSVLLVILYIAIIPTLVGYLLWNRSVAHIGAARAGVVYYSIPLFSSIEAVILLGEEIAMSQVIGGILIIGGILLSSLSVLRQMFCR